MTQKNDINDFVEILKDDIKTLKAGFEENGVTFNEKEYTYVINFNLFVEFTKKYCFKGKSKVIQVPTSIIPPQKESKLVSVTIIPVPEDRLLLFKDIILKNFNEKSIFTLSYVFNSHSETYDRERLYYRFFYILCNETFWQPDEIKEIVENLLDQWNKALEHQKMTVSFFLPLDSIPVQGKKVLEIQHKLKVMNISYIILEKSEKGISDWRFYSSVIFCRIELITKIYTSRFFSDPSYRNEREKYEKQYQEVLKDIHLLVNALYLNNFRFKWRRPIIRLPWWFNPELFDFQNLEKKPGIEKFLKREFFDQISSTYSDLKGSKLLDRNGVILNAYFRIFQHTLIDAYFIIDSFTFLEAMFTKGSNDYVKLRLRLNSASILTDNLDEFRYISKFFSRFYDIRSRVVHGSNWADEFEKFIRKMYNLNEGDISPAVIEFHNEFVSYLNSSLRLLIVKMKNNPNTIEEMSNDPLYFFNNSALTKEKNNRNEIIKDLKQKYKVLEYKYKNKWEEISSLFNLKEVG